MVGGQLDGAGEQEPEEEGEEAGKGEEGEEVGMSHSSTCLAL